MKLFFYSKKCEHSKLLISLMEQVDDLLNTFKCISVDINLNTKKRNPMVKQYHIKEVPTIIIDNEKYVGSMAYSYIDKIAFPASNNDINKNSQPVVEQQIDGYSNDFKNFSDKYTSFGDDKPNSFNTGFAQIGSTNNIISDKSIKETDKKHVGSDYEKLIEERAALDKFLPPVQRT